MLKRIEGIVWMSIGAITITPMIATVYAATKTKAGCLQGPALWSLEILEVGIEAGEKSAQEELEKLEGQELEKAEKVFQFISYLKQKAAETKSQLS